VDGLLVDTGCPATARELARWAKQAGVRRVVNTHHHEDHAGGNQELQRRLGLVAETSAATARILAAFPRLEFYRRVTWGQPADFAARVIEGELLTEHHRFLLVPTPGHCPDHHALFDPERRWLISGDLYIHERVRYLRADEDALGILASLRRALELEPELLICAHAGVIEDAAGALQRKIAFMEELRQEAQERHGRGLSPERIRDELLGREGWLTRLSRGHFSKLDLIRSLIRAPGGG